MSKVRIIGIPMVKGVPEETLKALLGCEVSIADGDAFLSLDKAKIQKRFNDETFLLLGGDLMIALRERINGDTVIF